MIGDKVLLRPTAYKGKHKIQDHWEDKIYEVVKQPFENMPVFKIKKQGDDDRVKMVHRIYYYHSYLILWIVLVNQIIVGLWLI